MHDHIDGCPVLYPFGDTHKSDHGKLKIVIALLNPDPVIATLIRYRATHASLYCYSHSSQGQAFRVRYFTGDNPFL